MYCKKCGKEIREGNIFCTNCGQSINEPVKARKNLKIYGTVFIIVLITIIGVVIIKNIDNKNLQENKNDEKQETQQVEDKEIDIKLYDIDNNKPSIITLSSTSETGAIYNFSKGDFKLAVQKVCEKNNLNYTENTNSYENYYGIIINSIYEISIIIEKENIEGIAFSSSKESENMNYIFREIIIELLGADYANEIVKANQEISNNQYRYINYSTILKTDLASLLLTQVKSDEEMKDWNLIKQKMNIAIILIQPMTKEKCNKYMLEFNEEIKEQGILIKENINGTTFKDTNSISYIKFTSDTEFEIIMGQEGSEAFSKAGTYRKNGNIVTFNVTYDSELEPSDYNGITEPFSPYEIQMNIIDANTLKYTDNYNSTYLFQK